MEAEPTNGASDYDVEPCAPGGLSSAELTECIAMIKRGGAVDPHSVARELPRARALVVGRRGDVIVGVGVIKRPRPSYAAAIAVKSRYPFDPNTPELGYVAIDLKHQTHGLSRRIVKELLAMHKGLLFATTDHPRMKRTLEKARFVRKGVEWEGKRRRLSLWIKE